MSRTWLVEVEKGREQSNMLTPSLTCAPNLVEFTCYGLCQGTVLFLTTSKIPEPCQYPALLPAIYVSFGSAKAWMASENYVLQSTVSEALSKRK